MRKCVLSVPSECPSLQKFELDMDKHSALE